MIRSFIQAPVVLFGLLLALAGSALAEIPSPSLRILALGDSLTAGYGLDPSSSFPAQLERALQAQGYNVRVDNAGVSGDTTAGGRARLDWSLATDPDLVILSLGANDALRALPPEQAQENLDAILMRLREAKVPVLLAGMLAPRNLGADYHRSFDSIFPHLAKKYGVVLYPFFLEGVAGHPELNQPDGLHPTAQGVAVIVEGILPLVKAALPEVL